MKIANLPTGRVARTTSVASCGIASMLMSRGPSMAIGYEMLRCDNSDRRFAACMPCTAGRRIAARPASSHPGGVSGDSGGPLGTLGRFLATGRRSDGGRPPARPKTHCHRLWIYAG